MQVSDGEQALPHTSAMLRNDSTAAAFSSHNASRDPPTAQDKQVHAAAPDSIVDLDDTIELQDSIVGAVAKPVNSSSDGPVSVDSSGDSKTLPSPQVTYLEPQDESSDVTAQTHHATEQSDADSPLLSEADSLDALATSAPRQSVPQGVATDSEAALFSNGDTDAVSPDDAASVDHASSASDADSADAAVSGVDGAGRDDDSKAADTQVVTQQQMDESGHADAFAKILESIPDHIKNMQSESHQVEASADLKSSAHPVSSDNSSTGFDALSSRPSAQYEGHVEL